MTRYYIAMNKKALRAFIALVLALTAGGAGYTMGNTAAPLSESTIHIPETNVVAPSTGTTRVLYSLDQKQNDKELIALIDAASSHIYFAIYEFTLRNVADALIAAKKRGVTVEGLVDSGESANSYNAPIIASLRAAGIPITTQHHASGTGIMHIKALVTDSAYAIGSYNWTNSATTKNDEILEIGTSPDLVDTYRNILRRLIDAYGATAAAQSAAAPVSGGHYSISEAANHIGEAAFVTGKLYDAHTSASGTVFLDFCSNYKTCPFSGVIFADDAKKFKSLSSLSGATITLSGTISSYQGKAEIIVSDPSQIVK